MNLEGDANLELVPQEKREEVSQLIKEYNERKAEELTNQPIEETPSEIEQNSTEESTTNIEHSDKDLEKADTP